MNGCWSERVNFQSVPLPSATKPKVTTQAYLIYLHSRMPVIKGKPEMLKEGTDKIDVTKITKALAAEWNALSAAEKKVRDWISYLEYRLVELVA